jgi:hypothetical protein
MTYAQVFDVIAEYANADGRVLPLFADRWSRWPSGPAGHAVLSALAKQAAYWEHRKPSIHRALTEAQVAVRNHL